MNRSDAAPAGRRDGFPSKPVNLCCLSLSALQNEHLMGFNSGEVLDLLKTPRTNELINNLYYSIKLVKLNLNNDPMQANQEVEQKHPRRPSRSVEVGKASTPWEGLQTIKKPTDLQLDWMWRGSIKGSRLS